MQHRGLRLGLLCLLIAAGALAASVAWSSEQRLVQLDQDRQAKDAAINRLLSTIASIDAAQRTYAEFGRLDVSLFTRVLLMIDRITTDAAGLRAAAGSTASSSHLEEFWTALSAVMGADARARELLAAGNESAAADALLVSSRSQLMSLDTSLQAFRAAEAEAHSDNRRAAVSRSHIALLAAAGLWLLGLIVFALVPRRITEIRTIAAPSVASPPATVPASHVDLADAARLTSDLARLTDPSRLSDALGRACAVLRARGAIVWLERGDELVAAAAFGYDSAVLQRLPPISRSADNATAAAWRKGEAQTVAGESGGYGAIVVPIPGPSEPLGAFAIEVPAGIEGDATVTSVATMVAAQLASVFAVWSTAPSAGAGPELDRQAAAS